MAVVRDAARRGDRLNLRDSVRRFGWGLADQMLSSATNFALGLVVARAVAPAEFGAFTVAYSIFTLSLGATRAIVCEPLVVRFSSVGQDRWRDGIRRSSGAAVAIGMAVGLACLAASIAFGGPLGTTLTVVGIFLPALLLQDACRYAFFAGGTGRSAFVNDFIWAGAMFAAMAVLVLGGRETVGWFTAAWAGGGTVAALVGLLRLRLAPTGPVQALRWLRRESELAPRFFAEFAITTGSSQLIVFGIGALTSLAELGRIRAGMIILGPLNILFTGASMATVPEGVRLLQESATRLAQGCRWMSLALAAAVFVWGIVVLGLPEPVGRLVLKANWEGARSVALPLLIGTFGSGLAFGAMTGLRALAAARTSLRARWLDALAGVVVVLGSAFAGGASGAAWGYAVTGSLRVLNWWLHLVNALREHEERPAGDEHAAG